MSKSRFLDNWSVREVQDIVTGLSRRKRFVWMTKFFLVLIALTLAGLLVVLPFTHPVEKRFDMTFSKLEKGEQEQTHMVNPRFQGINSSGEPYAILADVALQETRDRVKLQNLKGDITLKSGEWVSVLAKTAQVELAKKTLQLSGDVSLFSDSGYEFRTEAAFVDMDKGEAVSSKPVVVQGALGSLRAQGFHLQYQGKLLTFTGPVTVTIYP